MEGMWKESDVVAANTTYTAQHRLNESLTGIFVRMDVVYDDVFFDIEKTALMGRKRCCGMAACVDRSTP